MCYVRISGLDCLTIDSPRVINVDISCREVLTEADLIWLSHPHKHTHTYMHMHARRQAALIRHVYHPHSIKVASWRWAALKCVTAWQRLRCAWMSRCAWIVATDHGWSVAKLSSALPCLKHDKCGYTGVSMCVSKHCTDSEVCQAKHAECHQISVLLLPHVHGEIRESSDLNMTHLNMNRCTRTYFWPTCYQN